jgi:hypothetical protein
MAFPAKRSSLPGGKFGFRAALQKQRTSKIKRGGNGHLRLGVHAAGSQYSNLKRADE